MLSNLILMSIMLLLPFFFTWEIIILSMLVMMICTMKYPVLVSGEFLYNCGFQISNSSFLLFLLCMLSFFWAFSCLTHLSQQFSKKGILMLMLSLLAFLFMFFFSSETFMLYIMFELSVIPIFVIIMGWGYQSERINASLSLMFYTITASLPLLGAFIYMFMHSFSSKINYLIYLMSLNTSNLMKILIFCLMAAFLVKLPMYSVHLWLPKAHVEAPVFGSMILAAILLKLGSFGVLIFFPLLFLDNVNIFVSISIIGGVLVSLLCIRLVDLKMIIAYSSVSHMGCVLIPVMMSSNLSVMSGILLMIAHGVSSSAMFLMSYNLYQMNYSRSLLLTKGMLVFSSTIALMWFLILMINMAAPPTLNLLSEILMISSVLNQNKINFVLIMMLILAGSAYTLIIFSSSIQGTKIISMSNKVMSIMETLNVFNHLVWGFTLILSVSLMNF